MYFLLNSVLKHKCDTHKTSAISAILLMMMISSHIKPQLNSTYESRQAVCDLSLCSMALHYLIDFTIKIMLGSCPLNLWSHRYVCSNCGVWRWIIHFIFLTHWFCSHPSFSFSLPFLVFFISSQSPYFPLLSQSYSCMSLIPCVSICFSCWLSFLPFHSQLFLFLLYCQPLGMSQPSLLFIY